MYIYTPNPQTLIQFLLTISVRRQKDPETCAIILNLPKIKAVIITIYRSPTGNYNNFFRKFESFFESVKKKLIICGDININYFHTHNRRKAVR